jgi:hypothetical protein
MVMMKKHRVLQERSSPAPNSGGNATIYVLIVVALFAALTVILSRQNDTSESSRLDRDRTRILATQIMAYPLQVKQSIEMMTMTGVESSALDFRLPGQSNYSTPPHINKVFHPEGGGLVLARLPSDAVIDAVVTPPAGWYLGRSSNIEWSDSTDDDVVLVAWPLKQELCEAINTSITGNPSPVVTSNTIQNLFIPSEYPPGNTIHGGVNADLTVANCAGCEHYPSLCVQDSNGYFGFYSLIVNR